jgi:Tol biopolymer transport system component
MRQRLPTYALGALALAACDLGPPPFGAELVMEPRLLAPDVISTREDEYRAAFTPDGREVYFTRDEGGRGGGPRIYVSSYELGSWTEPEAASFSTYWEEEPSISPDGSRLVFSSRRDVPGWGPVPGNSNLWMVERTRDGGWSEPVPLAGEVNKPRIGGRGEPSRSEAGGIVLPDGTLLYSTEEEPERGADLYVAYERDGRWVNARPMLLNGVADEASPAVSPDGRLLVFHGFRDVYAPGDDLFVSERTDYGWTEPRRLPEPINTDEDEGYASFSPDGRFLFFSSDRGRGGMSIYYISVEALASGDGAD